MGYNFRYIHRFYKGKNYYESLRTTERCDLRLFCRGEEMTERCRAGFLATCRLRLPQFYHLSMDIFTLFSIPFSLRNQQTVICDVMICPSCPLTQSVVTTAFASSYWLEGPARSDNGDLTFRQRRRP